ncbi:Ig-like domain-containing protein [Myxococcus sp. AM011]|uniref:Ig-like domain-containing protein n=1 Tax=Myxococcus sp. AM011 TaxID=2745200 RepID=UPI0015959068|nr:Ig-like domain-containing protein [Myxococcus sp. AM011]
MVAVLLSAPACIEVPDITPVQGEARIRTPEGTAYTKGVLDIGLEVTGHRPDRVELLRDGEVLAVLESPYTYAWDTTGETEGEHRLRARVVFGETVFSGEERVVVVDRTAPQVVSRAPEPGAQDVWVKSPIQAVFSEPMKVDTMTSASVRLTVGGVDVVRTVSLSGDGKTLTVVPGTPISAPASAAIALTSAVTDLAGNALDVPTGPWDWEHPKVLFEPAGPVFAKNSGSIGSFRSGFGSDKQGNSIIVQTEKFLANTQLRVYSNTGSQWTELGKGLEARTGSFEPSKPILRFDPLDDSPVIAWHEGEGSNESERIYVARWMGNQWSYLGRSTGILPSHPDSTYLVMDLDATGKPLVAFYTDAEQTTYVYRWTSTTWEAVGGSINLQLNMSASSPFDIRAGPSQSLFLGIAGTKDGTPKLSVAQWDVSTWKPLRGTQPPVEVPFNASFARNPRLYVSPGGSPILTWLEKVGNSYAKAVSYVWESNEWKVYCPSLTPSADDHSEQTRLEFDNSGTLWMVWAKWGDSIFHIEQCTSGSWSHFSSSSTAPHPIPTATFSTFTPTQHTNGIQVVTTLPDGGTLVVDSYLNR